MTSRTAFALSRLLLLVTLLCAGKASASIDPRIIGGTNAANGQYPFIAALVSQQVTSSDLGAQFCAGSIVSANWILTAAHCVTETNGSLTPVANIAVIAGVTTLDPNAATGTRTLINGIIRYPGFSLGVLHNDLALIHLSSPVAIATGFGLDDNTITNTLVSGSPVTAIGWGLTSTTNTNSSSSVLQQVALDFIPYSTCDDSSHWNNALPANTICAGFLASPPRDTCNGDSGGPLLVATGASTWKQVGITSFGDSTGCAQSTFPGVYTRVGDFNAWINDVQTKPDLVVVISPQQTPPYGATVPVSIIVQNLSPASTATGVTINLARVGTAFVITDTDPTISCSGAGDISCNVGTLAPNGVVSMSVSLDFPGPGTYQLGAGVNSVSGDYNTTNNSSSASFTLPQTAHDHASGGGLPAGQLLLLAGALALRRRA